MSSVARKTKDVQVLIETYWNVKADKWRIMVLQDAVLIETYWNVKLIGRLMKNSSKPY